MSAPADDPYNLAWLHLDAAATRTLLAEHPPQRVFGELSDRAYEIVREHRGRTIAPGERIVGAIRAAIRDYGDARLVLFEFALIRYIEVWPPDGPELAARALREAWPSPSPALKRIGVRLQAWAQLRALGLGAPEAAALEHLLDLGRPPMLNPSFLAGLRALASGLSPDSLRAAAARLPAEAPIAHILLRDSPALAAELLEQTSP